MQRGFGLKGASRGKKNSPPGEGERSFTLSQKRKGNKPRKIVEGNELIQKSSEKTFWKSSTHRNPEKRRSSTDASGFKEIRPSTKKMLKRKGGKDTYGVPGEQGSLETTKCTNDHEGTDAPKGYWKRRIYKKKLADFGNL